MKIPAVEEHRRVFYNGEKIPLTAPSGGHIDEHTQAVGRERSWLSWQRSLLQVDVLGGAGVLQMFVVVLLEGSSADQDTGENIH